MPNLGVYIPDQLNARLQRLREKGLDLNASGVFQRALEEAVAAEERALAGDRLARVVARLRTARTTLESASGEGEAAGAQWAEDLAALSELGDMRGLLRRLESKNIDFVQVRVLDRVSLDLFAWDASDNTPVPTGDVVRLPESVPRDFFERANQPYDKDVHYTTPLVFGFLRGAVRVLDVVETAMTEATQARAEVTSRQKAALLGGSSKRVVRRRTARDVQASDAAPVDPDRVEDASGGAG